MVPAPEGARLARNPVWGERLAQAVSARPRAPARGLSLIHHAVPSPVRFHLMNEDDGERPAVTTSANDWWEALLLTLVALVAIGFLLFIVFFE
jgi:hypothetical protein